VTDTYSVRRLSARGWLVDAADVPNARFLWEVNAGTVPASRCGRIGGGAKVGPTVAVHGGLMDDSDESLLVRHVPVVDESALGWIRPVALRHQPDAVQPSRPAQVQMFVLSDPTAASMADPAAVMLLHADVDGITAALCALVVRPGASRRSLGVRILSDGADFLRAAGITRFCADPRFFSADVVDLLRDVGCARAADGRWTLEL
jgi:hypothetical protein